MPDNVLIPDWLPSSAKALQEFIKKHPNAESKVSEMLKKSLEKIDENTGKVVIEQFDEYFGKEITDMLFYIVQPDLKSQLPKFKADIPAEALSFLTNFATLYSEKLLSLSQASNQTSGNALEAFLEAHPEAEHHAREILDKHLKKIDASTWSNVFASLDNYWGKEATDILYNVAQPEQAGRLQVLDGFVSADVINFLRKIISFYGPELTSAFLASNQLPHGWKMFYRDVYHDYVNKRSHIRIRMDKYNGEEILFEGNADSILELIILMMMTIRFLPVPDFIEKPMIDRFIQESNQLADFLQPPPPKPEDDQTKKS